MGEMKFDDILVKLGEFGYYQKRLYLLICIAGISSGCFMMLPVFLNATPKHRCKIPGYSNDTWKVQSDYHQYLINQSIPLSDDSNLYYDQCHTYRYINFNATGNQERDLVKCSEWVYDTDTFKETFVSKNNLVCDDAIRASHSQMIYYFGVLFGDIGFGMLADSIGRKKTLMLSALIQVGVSTGTAFAPEFYSFVILQFIVGAACHGFYVPACVLSVEVTGPSKRVMTGIPIHMFFAVGIVYVSLMGFLLRHWAYVQLSVGLPCIAFLSYWWLIEESPRWLVSQKRYDEAERIVQKMAKANKANVQGKIIHPEQLWVPKTERLWKIFSHRVLLVRTIILFFNWIVVSMIYYGVTMHTRNLGGNFYLNFFILAIVEFPAKMLSMFLLNRLGRKVNHCGCMFIGGGTMLCTIFTVLYGGEAMKPLTLVFSIIGKMGSAAAFGIIYIYSAELYPTVVRNGGMGASSCIARFGGMAAPYIAQSGQMMGGEFGTAFPLVVFGACAVSAGILCCLFLPETLNRKLPETIRDGVEFGRKKKDDDYIVPNFEDTELIITEKNMNGDSPKEYSDDTAKA
ncbi:hypothetical protein FSP39_016703 [Pinctada imbricata]|uniref:Major facilitator superfamily (MFS) profile domain-containing protein n=1 Tax=Pinctada imbricata TaxID=66713 RepID=A0AA89BM64_PINIB|nr:hypothetical protein FSP39_016703 [Pinctada imbricata]